MTDPLLQTLYKNLQKEMKIKLEIGRDCIEHAPSKGDDSEIKWKSWLNDYLPKRYSTEKAFIIDSRGNISEQIDLVIYDKQYSPPLFKQDSSLYITAESVYAVFEVKQTLNRSHIEYAKKKAASVRILHRTSAPVRHAGGTYEPLPPKPILAGILTYECDWIPSFGESFTEALKTNNSNEHINLGCVVCKGGFETDYTNGTIAKSKPEYSLVFFFLKLLSKLQSVGTVTAIDIPHYLNLIEED